MLVCHDLKFENDPIAPPLSNGLRMIPVLFYLSIVGCAFFVAYFMIQKNAAERARVAQEQITADEKKKIAQVQMKHNELEGDVKKANSMIDWVRGSTPIQGLAMIVNNAMASEDADGTTINMLKLSRVPESPWQIKLDLTLNTTEQSYLDLALDKLSEGVGTERYKRFSPQRSQSEATINYTATLIRE